MKRIVTFIIAVMTMATIQGQTMTERQKGLAACACLMAQGDLERLEPAVKMALDNGVTIRCWITNSPHGRKGSLGNVLKYGMTLQKL